MAEAEHDNASQSESEKQLVQELLKFTIYGEQTTLDGIIEAAKKSLNETKARVKELKTLFGGEQDQGQDNFGIVPSSSPTTEVLDVSTLVNREDENIPENKDTASVNDSLRDFRQRRRLKYCCKGFQQYQNKGNTL